MKVIIGRPPQVVAAVAASAKNDPVASLGAWLFAMLFTVFSLGLLSSQVSTYYSSFPKDNRWLKRLVAAIYGLSVMQFGMVFAVGWQWFVSAYGDWETVVIVPWTVSLEPIVAYLNVMFPQMFFAYRCFILTGRNWFVLTGLAAAMITSLIFFTVMSAQLTVDPYYYSAMKPIKRLTTPGLIITVLTDCFITGLMTWKLMTSRKGSNPNTDTGLMKFLAAAWEAAALPAAVAITSLVVFIDVAQRPVLYTVFNILVPRLYAFSVMFTLNSRSSIQDIFDGNSNKGATSSIALSQMKTTGGPRRGITSGLPHKTTTIVFSPEGMDADAHAAISQGGLSRGRDPPSVVEVQVDIDKWEVRDDDASEEVSDLEAKTWSNGSVLPDLEKLGPPRE